MYLYIYLNVDVLIYMYYIYIIHAGCTMKYLASSTLRGFKTGACVLLYVAICAECVCTYVLQHVCMRVRVCACTAVLDSCLHFPSRSNPTFPLWNLGSLLVFSLTLVGWYISMYIHVCAFTWTLHRRLIIQRGHEQTRTGNWSESGFRSQRGAPWNV